MSRFPPYLESEEKLTPEQKLECIKHYGISEIVYYNHNLMQIFFVNGKKEWYYHRVLHSVLGMPAIESSDGTRAWYYNGFLHRRWDIDLGDRAYELPTLCSHDLPAIIHANGDKEWYCYGQLHRANGLPAIEYHDGRKEWYNYGRLIATDHGKN
jgi:hypothetical protein